MREYAAMISANAPLTLRAAKIAAREVLLQSDLLAADLSDFFTTKHGDARPYAALAVPEQTASRWGP